MIRCLIAAFCTTVMVLSWSAWGFAGLFDPPFFQHDYPSSEVERPITLSKGWAEFMVGYSYRSSDSFFDDDGSRTDGLYDFVENTIELALRYGWTRNLTLGLTLPYAFKEFSNDEGLEMSGHGLGDGSFWLTYQALHRADPLSSVAFRFRAEFPMGNESPGGFSNDTLEVILFGRGVYSLHGSVLGKKQLADFAFLAEAGYTVRLPGTVMYVAGVQGQAGRIDFGDEVFLNGAVLWQLPGPVCTVGAYLLFPFVTLPLQLLDRSPEGLVIAARARYVYRGETEYGVRGHLDSTITNGWTFDLDPEATLQIGPHCDLRVSAKANCSGRSRA